MQDGNSTPRDQYAALMTKQEDLRKEVITAITKKYPQTAETIVTLSRHVGDIVRGATANGCAPGTVGWGILCGLLQAAGFNPADETHDRDLDGKHTQTGIEIGIGADAVMTSFDTVGFGLDKQVTDLLNANPELAGQLANEDGAAMMAIMKMALEGGDGETSDVVDGPVTDVLAEPAEAFAPDLTDEGASGDDEDELL